MSPDNLAVNPDIGFCRNSCTDYHRQCFDLDLRHEDDLTPFIPVPVRGNSGPLNSGRAGGPLVESVAVVAATVRRKQPLPIERRGRQTMIVCNQEGADLDDATFQQATMRAATSNLGRRFDSRFTARTGQRWLPQRADSRAVMKAPGCPPGAARPDAQPATKSVLCHPHTTSKMDAVDQLSIGADGQKVS